MWSGSSMMISVEGLSVRRIVSGRWRLRSRINGSREGEDLFRFVEMQSDLERSFRAKGVGDLQQREGTRSARDDRPKPRRPYIARPPKLHAVLLYVNPD